MKMANRPILVLSLTETGFTIHKSDPKGVLRIYKTVSDQEAAECHPLLGLALLRGYAQMVDEITEFYEGTKSKQETPMSTKRV